MVAQQDFQDNLQTCFVSEQLSLMCAYRVQVCLRTEFMCPTVLIGI